MVKSIYYSMTPNKEKPAFGVTQSKPRPWVNRNAMTCFIWRDMLRIYDSSTSVRKNGPKCLLSITQVWSRYSTGWRKCLMSHKKRLNRKYKLFLLQAFDPTTTGPFFSHAKKIDTDIIINTVDFHRFTPVFHWLLWIGWNDRSQSHKRAEKIHDEWVAGGNCGLEDAQNDEVKGKWWMTKQPMYDGVLITSRDGLIRWRHVQVGERCSWW